MLLVEHAHQLLPEYYPSIIHTFKFFEFSCYYYLRGIFREFSDYYSINYMHMATKDNIRNL